MTRTPPGGEVFITDGKGGRQRLIPVSGQVAVVAVYLDAERPPGARTDRILVMFKGPRPRAAAVRQGNRRVPAVRRRPGPSTRPATSCDTLPDPATGPR
jgi:integrase/recombinase XerD